MEIKKDPKDLRIVKTISRIVFTGLTIVVIFFIVKGLITNNEPLSNCPFDTKIVAPPHASYFLPAGTIFGIHNSKGKMYYISDESPLFLDVFAKELMPQTTCFKTTEEAEAAGYTFYSE